MGMLDKLIAKLNEERKTIVFTEGSDPRILAATDRLVKDNLMDIILCGDKQEVEAAAKAANANIGLEIF